MRVVAVVLTHNAATHGRTELLDRTLQSLHEADELLLIDNGSDDGTEAVVAARGGYAYRADDGNTTCGRGMNVCITAAAKRGDLVVFSNDDIIWHPGWRPQLQTFWTGAGQDIAIASGLLEESYPWNQPRGLIQIEGIKALRRETVPGGAWTLRSTSWAEIGPVPEVKGWDDVPTCHRLNAAGKKCVALDLADHAGVELSTWGNNSPAYGQPLDRDRWGI